MTTRLSPLDLAARLVRGNVQAVDLVLDDPRDPQLPRVWSVRAEAGAFWLVEDGRFAELFTRELTGQARRQNGDPPPGALEVATDFVRRRQEREVRQREARQSAPPPSIR